MSEQFNPPAPLFALSHFSRSPAGTLSWYFEI